MKSKKEIMESLGIKSSAAKAFWGFSLAIVVLLIVYIAGVFILTGKGVPVPGQTSNVFYWTGAATDGNWSSPANWNQKKVPGVGSEVIFDAKSNKESVVDEAFSGEIASLKIENYDSKIVQNDDLTITGDYYQSSGEYEAVGSLLVKGNFEQKEGSVFSFGLNGLSVDGAFDIFKDGFEIKDNSFALINYKDQPRRYGVGEHSGEDYKASNKMESGEQLPEGFWNFSNRFNVLESKISQLEGWELIPYGGGWNWKYVFENVQRGNAVIYESQNSGITSKENVVSIDRGNGIEEYYKNSYEGIEQVFVLENKPLGSGELKLAGRISMKDLKPRINSPESISFFTTEDNLAFNLDHLKVYDSVNKEFKAKMNLLSKGDDAYVFEIIVDEDGAIYPLTIDPLSSTPDWSAQESVADTWFGKFVSEAGDVNGDGYGDIITSAYQDDGGVYAYYGSSLGLSGGASSVTDSYQWSKPLGIYHLGFNISKAGNVNGDKHPTLDSDGDGVKNDLDDVIAGDTNSNTGDGVVNIFNGSTSGLASSASRTIDGDGVETFGFSVANAGDVNKDGYDDVLVGAPNYAYMSVADKGRAYLYLGSSSGIGASSAWAIRGVSGADYFGFAVAGAGDINRDGCADVAVGAPGVGNGRVYLYYGCGTGCSCTTGVLSASPLIFDSPSATNFGISLASADLNKDGYLDLAVGASGSSDPFWSGGSGAVYVYYGNPTGLNSTVGWTYTNAASLGLGYSIASAGDVNGDACDDLVVGSWSFAAGFYGNAHLFYGCNAISGGGLPVTADWTSTGLVDKGNYGFDVSSAGDVNGDGKSEILIGSYHNGYSKAFMFKGFDGGACSPLNAKPEASISGFSTQDLCQGLNYTLNWGFSDTDTDASRNQQSAYDIEVKERGTETPVLSDKKYVSENFYKILNGAVGSGTLVYGKKYEWRVRVYDNDSRPSCGGVSEWSAWSDFPQGFETPKNQYPSASFTASCLIDDSCDFLKPILVDGSASKFYSVSPITPPTYAWYIDNKLLPDTASSINKTFLEAEGKDHSIKLIVTDNVTASDRYSCSVEKNIKLGVSRPSWTEVTPR